MTNFYTPGIYALESGGWAYAPWGDIYALTPLWGESHGVTGETVYPEDEVNRYALVCAYDSDVDPYFVLTVTEDDPDTTTVLEEDVPTGTPVMQTRIWVTSGFNEEKALPISMVMDEGVWTGAFKVAFPLDVRRWVGPGRVGHFAIDYWTEEAPETRVRIAFGTAVFRR